MKRLGDPVRAGETLAIVESRDAAQFAADRTAAAAKSTLAQKALAREQYLFRQKVSARVELEQAEAEADRKSTRLELQSLMRISYAVFCLKKKKENSIRHQPIL